MIADLRGFSPWPLAFAILFLLVPLLFFYSYPSSFWANTDYDTLGLADALNMAYRVADHKLYPARGLEDHPGVPFYFISWLALALSGHPVAPAGSGFFNRVIENIEEYHQITVWLNALAGAVGVYIFARVARKVAPIGVVAVGLLLWLASTPATLLMFLSPSIDSFAIVINGLFFAILLRLAYENDVNPTTVILSACVGALAYLNKLSYVYIPFALAGAGILNLAFRRVSLIRGSLLSIAFVFTLLFVVAAAGFFIIGWHGFEDLYRFHKSVVLGTGLYGAGPQNFVSKDAVWRAFAAIPVDKAYAVIIALVGGAALVAGGLVTGMKRSQHVAVAVVSIGAGAASVLSALFVIKHYDLHYTAGISATLPASAVSAYLLSKSWGYTPRFVATAVAAVAILLMADQTMGPLTLTLTSRSIISRQAKADLEDIQAYLARSKLTVEFGYRAPLSWSGEGFVIVYASVPRLNSEYAQNRQQMFSSMAAGLVNQDAGAYVIDKSYFPTAESVKNAPNVILIGPKPVTFKDGDKLIELRTVFLLIPG